MLEINFSSEELIASHPSAPPSMFPESPMADSPLAENVDSNLSDYYNFNFSGREYDYAELWMRHSPAITAVFCIAYSVVFVLGILGNSLVISVVIRSPRMRTVTNFFIVNLACADILVVIFCLPATLLANLFVPWMLGLVMCKTVSYLQGVSVSASINTLVAISIDRFLAICYPLKCQMTPKNARRIIVVIWVFSLSITLPWALYFSLIPIDPSAPDVAICMELWPHEQSETHYFLVANLGLCYLLPLGVISMCYIGIWIKVWRRSIPGETKGTNADVVMQRSKLKEHPKVFQYVKVMEQNRRIGIIYGTKDLKTVVKIMVVVVVLFVLSWLPLYVIFTMVKLGSPIEQDSEKERVLMVLAPIAQWLGASNSCINPVLYTFFNKKFRKGFLAILRSRSCCGTLRYEAASKKGTRSTVLRSTFKSRDTQCEYISTAQV